MAASSVPQEFGALPTSSSMPVQVFEWIDIIVQRLKSNFPNITFVFVHPRQLAWDSFPRDGDICVLSDEDNNGLISTARFESLRYGERSFVSDSSQEAFSNVLAQFSSISTLILFAFHLFNMTTIPNKLFDILTTGISLKKLQLSRCLVGQGFCEFLAATTSLTELIISHNNLEEVGGIEIGRGLAINSTLITLNFSSNELTDVGGMEIGKGLAVNSTLSLLNLSSNQLGEVGGMEIGIGLAANSSLLELDISWNRLGDIGFRMIANALCNSPLQTLDVSSSSITTIPSSLGFSPSLTSLDISYNPLIEPTSEFVKSASLDQLKAYLRSPRVEILRVRLSVVGYHGVGKTTLTTHLLHPEIQSQEQLDLKMHELKLDASTHGIKTHLLQIPCAELGGKTIKFNTFDFAGQPIYYSNHRHFLGQHRVVYLIVFKATDSKMEVERQVNHWCNLIASQIHYKWRELFASSRLPKPSVIVVGTHLNLCKNKKQPTDLKVWFRKFIRDGLYASVFDIQPELLWIDHDAPETIVMLLDLVVKNGVTQLRNVNSTASPLPSCPSPSSSSSSSSLSSHPEPLSSSLLSHPEIVSRALAEIDRIRGSASQWRLFYTLEEFQNTVLLADNPGDNDTVQLLIRGIGIENLIIQMQAMGEVVYLPKAKKICIEPQRVFDLLADFVKRHRKGERDDQKSFVNHHDGIVSVEALQEVCDRYNIKISEKFKQRDLEAMSLDELIETLIDFDLCVKMADDHYLFPSLLASNSTREHNILNEFYSDAAPRFDMQWQVANADKREYRAFLPSIMFGIQIDCYRTFTAPRFFLESWPTGILIERPEQYKIMVAMIPEAPGGIRFSIQVGTALNNSMTEFVEQSKQVLEIVFVRIRSSMFQSTRVVGLCGSCSDLKLVPDDRLHHFVNLNSNTKLQTLSVELEHTIRESKQIKPSIVRSCLPLTPLWLLIDLYRARKRNNHFFFKTEFFLCSRDYNLSSAISDSPFHHPEFIRLASDSASQDSLHPPPLCTPAYPLSSSQLPTCSSSHPYNNHPLHSQSAHRQIKQAAFEFNQLMKAPRTAVTAADVALWSFSAGIQPSSDVVHFLKTQFELLRPQLINTFEEMCKDMPQVGEFPFEFKLDARQGGSVANQTYLTSPDLDIYLVLNSTRSLKTMKGENDELQFEYGGIKVTSGMVTLIVSACAAAVEQFLNIQDGLFALTATDFVSDGMTVFTLKESIERFEGLQLEFDVVPVLQVIGGKFLMLSKDGTLKPTSTELAAHTIGVYSAQFPGLREMMVVLKLVHKAGIKQQLASLGQVPSCALEMVVLLLVKQKRESAAVWWRESSFTDIFREAISELLNCIHSDRLPAPNNPNDDLLIKIRDSPSEFVQYYSGWFQIEESNMLSKLKVCLSQVVSAS